MLLSKEEVCAFGFFSHGQLIISLCFKSWIINQIVSVGIAVCQGNTSMHSWGRWLDMLALSLL